MRRSRFLFFFLCLPGFAFAQQTYSNYVTQVNRIQSLQKQFPALAKAEVITKTFGGKDIWQLTIGTGNTAARPAIAVVGGVEGNHLLGMELAIGFAEELLKASASDSIKTLLSKTTFYVYPNMSPDAMEQYFSKLPYERMGNASVTDDDRDGKLNEDPLEDLDGNGKITMMRVLSPLGDYKPHPDDPRILIRADMSKGEKGKYLLFTEGLDNDKDGSLNEDGEGGVWFNKNFTHRHPSFTPGAGEYAVSESETRALLDRLFEMYNVYTVVSFGTHNNLSNSYTFNPSAASQNLVNGWLQPDIRVNTLVSDLYNKTVNLKDAPRNNPEGGDFASWAYYHYGRYSFSTPGWWVPKAKPDTARKEKPFSIEDAGANYLRWAAQQGITDGFTEWKSIQHPDFPGQTVEVGGIHPFVLVNPPFAMVNDLVKKHTAFLVKLATYQPELDIVNLKTEKVENGVTRVTATVMNKGAMATHAKLGERTYWLKRVQVRMNTLSQQQVLSGRKVQLLPSLEGYASQEMTWLIKGKGKVTIEASTPTAGTKTIDINL